MGPAQQGLYLSLYIKDLKLEWGASNVADLSQANSTTDADTPL